MKPLFALSALFLVGCAHSGPRVKVYYLDASQGGLVRKQNKEFLSFDQALGYRCLSATDFDALLLNMAARGAK